MEFHQDNNQTNGEYDSNDSSVEHSIHQYQPSNRSSDNSSSGGSSKKLRQKAPPTHTKKYRRPPPNEQDYRRGRENRPPNYVHQPQDSPEMAKSKEELAKERAERAARKNQRELTQTLLDMGVKSNNGTLTCPPEVLAMLQNAKRQSTTPTTTPNSPTLAQIAATAPPNAAASATATTALAPTNAKPPAEESQAVKEMKAQLAIARSKKKDKETKQDMEKMIHTVCKERLWRRVKLVNGDVERRNLTIAVLEELDLAEYKGHDEAAKQRREEWIEAYETVCAKKLNAVRGYAQTRCKAAIDDFKATFGRFPTQLDFMKCLTRTVDINNKDDYDLFKWYWTSLMPRACCNDNDWNKDKRNYLTIIEGCPPNQPGKNYITPSTEAMAVCFWESNEVRWAALEAAKAMPQHSKVKHWHTKPRSKIEKGPNAKEFTISADGESCTVMGEKYLPKYTKIDAGQIKDSGFTKKARNRFKELQKQCKEARAEPQNLTKEKDFLKKLKAELGLKHSTAREEQLAKRRKTRHHEDDDVAVDEEPDEWDE